MLCITKVKLWPYLKICFCLYVHFTVIVNEIVTFPFQTFLISLINHPTSVDSVSEMSFCFILITFLLSSSLNKSFKIIFLGHLNNNVLSIFFQPNEKHSFNIAKVIFLKIKPWAFYLLLKNFQCLITFTSNLSVWHLSTFHYS